MTAKSTLSDNTQRLRSPSRNSLAVIISKWLNIDVSFAAIVKMRVQIVQRRHIDLDPVHSRKRHQLWKDPHMLLLWNDALNPFFQPVVMNVQRSRQMQIISVQNNLHRQFRLMTQLIKIASGNGLALL